MRRLRDVGVARKSECGIGVSERRTEREERWRSEGEKERGKEE